MNLKPGTYNLGPIDGTVQVKTGRQGLANKPVSDRDKKDIRKNITGLLGNKSITFTSTSVEVKDSSVKADGDLSIAGQSRPVTLDLTATPDGLLAGSMMVVQSEFGIKPFSAMMGALKVKDEVEVNLDVALPSGSSS